ncbi:hypothetical protein QR680_014912 [Steinernema hermaphroditum]|uniref:Small-subunit processome Utp12 domain-containing protein n=1 Tax=Steinernema hermaphroditum TaxID=289476 RepID=A0AA39M4N9_9BILA|nr:hypothetical protein QR680_014912 [Steinernema hermaphroditum]
MGLTKQYLRYKYDATCNIVGSQNGAIQSVSKDVFAVVAAENVNFLNVRTGERVGQIEGSTKMVTAIKLSADKHTIAVGYDDGEIRLVRRENEDHEEVVFSGHKTGVNCLQFSNDGLTLASGGKDGTIILWDVVSESGMFRLNGHKASVTQLQFTQDDEYVISSSKDTFVKFWSISTQSCFYTLTDCRSQVYSFALLRNDRLLVIGCAEIELRVFELVWLNRIVKAKEEELTVDPTKRGLFAGEQVTASDNQENSIVACKSRGSLLRQATGRALQMSWSTDGKLLCCVGGQMVDIFRVYDEQEAERRMFQKVKRSAKRKAEEANENVDDIVEKVSKDVMLLLSRIAGYETSDRSKVKWIEFCPGSFSATDGSDLVSYRLFALHTNNTVHGLSIEQKGNDFSVHDVVNLDKNGHRTDVRAMCMSSTGAAFASGSSESAIVWNLHSFKATQTLSAPEMKDITAALFVTGDRHLLLGTKSGNIFLFDIATNVLLDTFTDAHETAIYGMVPYPDKKGFASVSADKKVAFWAFDLVTVRDQKQLTIVKKRELLLPDEGTCLQISPDGKFITVGLLDNTARVYFMDSLKHLSTLYGHALPVTCIDISHNSKLVITGSTDKSVKIWGLDFGDCHKSLHAHDEAVTCVMFDKTEALFWSAGKDGKIKQWDAVKFERIQVLSRHSGEVWMWSLVQTPDSKSMLSCSHDKTIRVWEQTEEIIVLQEEEEVERESSGDVELAAKKTIDTVRSAENVMEAVEIMRDNAVNKIDDSKHVAHPLLQSYVGKSIEYFIIDTIGKVKSSHLEKSLLMIPFSYAKDILTALAICVRNEYRAELSCRVILFLIKVHHSLVENSLEVVKILNQLEQFTVGGLSSIKGLYGFNLMALRTVLRDIQDRTSSKLFTDIGFGH